MAREARSEKPDGRLCRVAFYLRRSAEEVIDNYSIETQERVCREKADRVFGAGKYQLIDIFKDPGRSGRLGLCKPGVSERNCRHGLSELIELVDAGGLDAVVVYKLDRLSRRARLLLDLLDDHLVPRSVDLYSAGEEIDIVSAYGRFTVQLMGVLAELYSTQAAERTKDGIRNRRAQGYLVGSVGYGWRLQTAEEANGSRRSIAREEEQGRWLVHMKDRLLSGWGMHRITEELNRLGVPSRRGKLWTSTSVYGVLLNPAHAGLTRVDGELRPGNFTAQRYWDRETYDRLRVEVARHRRVPAPTKTATQYLLSEVLVCQGCGHRTYASSRPKAAGQLTPYYRCRTRPSLPGCHGAMIKAELVESAVIEELRRIALGDELQRLAEGAIENLLDADAELLQDRGVRLAREQVKLEKQLDRWAEQLTTGKVSQEQFDRYNRGLWRRLQECRLELEEVQQAQAQRSARKVKLEGVRESLRNFDSIWRSLGEDQRRHLVGLLIERASLEWRGHESVLRLTPFGLPEREVVIKCTTKPSSHGPDSKVETLTPRHLAILHLLDQGLTVRETAKRLRQDPTAIQTQLSEMRRRTGIRERQRLIELARPLVQRKLHLLPVEGRATARPSAAAKEPNALVKQALTIRAQTHMSLNAIARELGCKFANLYAAMYKWYARLGVDGIEGLVAEAHKRGWIPFEKTEGDNGNAQAGR